MAVARSSMSSAAGATNGFEKLRATCDSSVWALALFGSNRHTPCRARYYSLRRRAWGKISPLTPETGIISSLRVRFTLCASFPR